MIRSNDDIYAGFDLKSVTGSLGTLIKKVVGSGISVTTGKGTASVTPSGGVQYTDSGIPALPQKTFIQQYGLYLGVGGAALIGLALVMRGKKR